MSLTCQYCNKTLSSKSTLYHHQKKAKYCLRIQNIQTDLFKCEACMKTFTSRQSEQYHKERCIDYYNRNGHNECNLKIKMLEQQVKSLNVSNKELQDQLASLASEAIRSAKPNITKNTTTTYINMLVPLPAREQLSQLIQNGFERKYFVRGQIGLAEFINDSLVQDNENMYYLVCSDTARQVFRFKDQFGNVIKDPCMKQFTNMIAEPVKLKTEEHLRKIEDVDPLYIDRAREIAREFYKLHNDNTELSKAMSALVPNQTMMVE
jgi:hypothetical protein